MKKMLFLFLTCIVGLSSVAYVSCSSKEKECALTNCIVDTEPDILINVYTTEYLATISPRNETSLSLKVGVEYIFECDMLYSPHSCSCSTYYISDYETKFEYDTDYLLITDTRKSIDKIHYYYVSALAPTESTILTATLAIAPLEINVSISDPNVDITDDEIATNDDGLVAE